MQRVRLLWTDPSTGEDQERLLTLPITLGRAQDNSLVLTSNIVSGHHARIHQKDDDSMAVEDLQSRNGTRINGKNIIRNAISFGDVIQVGPFALLVQPAPGAISSPPRLGLSWVDAESGQTHEREPALPLTIGRDPDSDISLDDPQVSRAHARIERKNDMFVVTDLNSSNGLYLNGQRTTRATLRDGSEIQIGPFTLHASVSAPPPPALSKPRESSSTILLSDTLEPDTQAALTEMASAEDRAATAFLDAPSAAEALPAQTSEDLPEWPPAIFQRQQVPIKILEQLGVPIITSDYAALGAGLGSFTWVDNLVISGVRPEQIIALGTEPDPHGRYRRLCANSQIPDHERLRSNTESTPDNIWGWPGYALREMWHDTKRGHLGHAWNVFLQIFGEPHLTQTYTPKAGNVFASIEREAHRIGWHNIYRYGRIRAIRKTDDGRYVVAFSQRHPDNPEEAPHALLIANYIHLATGYPALRILPDLYHYRVETGDFQSVVNAYEQHNHVYEHLEEHGGTVVLRGRGIVASRIIQRLYEARSKNEHIGIVHLMRTPKAEGHQFGRAQRDVSNHFEFQPFNWPRSCWTGELRKQLEQATPEERKQLLSDWGGTTTANRQDWRYIIEKGLREGWYKIEFGSVREVERGASGKLETVVETRGQIGGELRYEADFIIDATGLESDANTNPLLQDMIEHYKLRLNPLHRLHVETDFEIPGLYNEPGRAYAAGSITLGGPMAAVDSFLGLQYCAQVAVDALHRHNAPGLHYLKGWRSVAQWLKWVRGEKP